MLKARIAGGAFAFVFASLAFHITTNPAPPRYMAVYAFAFVAIAYWLAQLVRGRSFNISWPTIIGLAVLSWSALSLLWSPDPQQGALELIRLGGLFVVFVAIASTPLEILTDWLGPVVAVTVLIAFGLTLIFPDISGGFGNENFASEFFLIAMPLTLAIWTGRPLWFFLLLFAPAVSLVYLFGYNGSSEKYFVVLLVALYVVYKVLRDRNFLLASIIIATPVFAIYFLDLPVADAFFHSMGARAEIAISTAVMWIAAPFAGHGLGSFNYTYPEYQESYRVFLPWLDTVFIDFAKYAGAAHNEPLQILAELGLVGFALVAAGAVYTVRVVSRRKRDVLDITAIYSLIVAAWLSLISFPLQNVSTSLLIAIAAGVLCQGAKTVKIPTILPARVLAVVVGASLIVSVGTISFKDLHANLYFTNFRAVAKSDRLAAFKQNLQAYQVFAWPRRIRHQLSASLGNLMAQDHKRIRLKPKAADKIYQISKSAAGRTFSVEFTRLQYLYNSGRWQTEPAEVLEKRKWLKTHAGQQAPYYILEAYLSLKQGDIESAAKATLDGFGLDYIHDLHRKELNALAKHIKEISK